MTKQKIKPCPFCESEERGLVLAIGESEFLRVDSARGNELVSIQCRNCMTVGPALEGESGAVRAWNERGKSSLASGGVSEEAASVQIGCLDGGCIWQKPKGMCTNGGCSCERALVRRLRAMGYSMSYALLFVRMIRATRESLEDAQ